MKEGMESFTFPEGSVTLNAAQSAMGLLRFSSASPRRWACSAASPMLHRKRKGLGHRLAAYIDVRLLQQRFPCASQSAKLGNSPRQLVSYVIEIIGAPGTIRTSDPYRP
ncbi:MAG: hypothetical protein EB015_21670 [Methylocystaceae bacterium]|nr:hypothetical protein [Methylocystaceae bacterium]